MFTWTQTVWSKIILIAHVCDEKIHGFTSLRQPAIFQQAQTVQEEKQNWSVKTFPNKSKLCCWKF